MSEARPGEVAPPSSAGTAYDAATSAVARAVGAGETPGAVLAAGWGDETELLWAYGWAQTGACRRPMTTGTVFDLASLTKVVGTLPVVLHLLADGWISLESRVAELLPGFSTGAEERARVTVEHLLTHTSGLPAHREYWRLGLEPAELARQLLEEPLVAPPGSQVVYSDIGFIVLGWVAEAVTGRPLDALVTDWVVVPLGLARTGYAPAPGDDVAATEPGPDGSCRTGVVHDETAAALAVPVGHAGLFSTAGDLAAYLGGWVSSGDGWLPQHWRQEAVRDRTASLGGHRGLGWVARGDAFDRLGRGWPSTAVSHTGFTGTSLALDPPSGRWVVFLTNDVHFGRDRGTITPLRLAVHEALAP
ncbi:MAG TPA: serine hydrolase domain-containing protein [Acidimicrobiales bacterium]|nr:serine hydrolase domain-containing protein [Acidimicrobiales bacterium]